MYRIQLLSSLLCVALLSGISAARADELTAEKKADIIKLLTINGSDRVVEPLSAMVTQSYMQSLQNCSNCSPKIPDVVRQETKSVLSAHISGSGGLMEDQVPVYADHFTHAEIKQLVTFYSSPVGKKLIAQANEVTRGTIEASQKWLTGFAPEIRQRVDVALTKGGIKPVQQQTPPPGMTQPPATK